MKKCPKCEEEKSSEDFFKSSSSRDGLQSYCKLCKKELQKTPSSRASKARYKKTEKGKAAESRYSKGVAGRAAAKRYREGDAGKAQAEKRKVIYANSDELKIRKKNYSHKYNQTEHGKIVARNATRKYLTTEKGKEANKRNVHRYYAMKANLPSTLTVADWQEILELYGNRCVYCNTSDAKLEQEHIVPVIKGGGYTKDNIVPACGSCNSSKGSKPLLVWMNYRMAYGR